MSMTWKADAAFEEYVDRWRLVMKAKNPNGSGFIDVQFPHGVGYTRWEKVCTQCDVSCGGCFTGPDLPEAEIHPRSICPRCGENKHIVLRKVS